LRIKSTFLLCIFVAFLAAPTLITFTNTDADFSTYFSLNEEEHKDGPKVDGNKEIDLENKKPLATFTFSEEQTLSNFSYIESWKTLHSETVSPPPEQAS